MKIRSLGGLRRWNNKAEYLKDDKPPIVLEWFIEWWFKCLREQRLNQCREAYWELLKFTVKSERIAPYVATHKCDTLLLEGANRLGQVPILQAFHNFLQGK